MREIGPDRPPRFFLARYTTTWLERQYYPDQTPVPPDTFSLQTGWLDWQRKVGGTYEETQHYTSSPGGLVRREVRIAWPSDDWIPKLPRVKTVRDYREGSSDTHVTTQPCAPFALCDYEVCAVDITTGEGLKNRYSRTGRTELRLFTGGARVASGCGSLRSNAWLGRC